MKTFKIIFALALCLLYCAPQASAQKLKLYSAEQGLSSTLINQVYQDKRGYLWIATENGLNRFDGINFVTYKQIPDEPNSLINNHITALFEDGERELYIGGANFLILHDFLTGQFDKILVLNEQGNENFTPISHITQGKDGEIWVTCAKMGLFRIHRKEDGLVCLPESELNSQLASLSVSAFYWDSQDRLWIGYENHAWQVYSSDNYSLIETAPLLTDATVSSFAEDKEGNVYIGLSNGLVQRSYSGEYRIIADEYGDKHTPMKSLLYSSNGLYVGTDGKGLKLYNPKRNILEPYRSSKHSDLTEGVINDIFQDRDGNIWLGSFRKGLVFISGNLNGFENYRYKYLNKENKDSGMLTAVYKNEHSILIGTNNDGIYTISQESGEIKHHSRVIKPQGIPANILLIQEAPKGKFFLGSFTDGLALFDPLTDRCKYYHAVPADAPPLNKVSSMVEDDKGNLWIGTYGNGLYQFDIKTERIVKHFGSTENKSEEGLASNTISALVFDGKHLWIGTPQGLSRMEMAGNRFISYYMSNIGLPSDIILALQEDESGFLWIGTDRGLACLYKLTQEIDVFTTSEGLSNQVINSIEQDDTGNLWISTLSGISMYSKSSNSFYNFYNSDGLQGSEFTRGASFKAADGEIFFIGTNGITAFFPQNIRFAKKELNVFINRVYLYNNPVSFGDKSGRHTILSNPSADSFDITLQETDNVFSIELTTLQYNNPEEIVYSYQLEGFDSEWLSTPAGNGRITYTNLAPGTYRFIFYADDRGVKSPEKEITIRILPIWYNTVWVRICMALLLIALVYVVVTFIRSRRQPPQPLSSSQEEETTASEEETKIPVKPEIIAPKKTSKQQEKAAKEPEIILPPAPPKKTSTKKGKKKDSPNDILLSKIDSIIDRNIRNAEFSVEQLADELGMSRVHLHRKLKEITGKSASNYIREIKLAKAVKLLKNSKLSISEVASASGFSTLSHFSSSFKEHYGVSPREYMKNV